MSFHDPEVDALLGNLGGAPAKRELAMGAYEGASRIDREVALWTPSRNSADRDIMPDKATADARSRDMVRNDGYVRNAVNYHRDSIVGSMYILSSKPDWKTLGLDEEWAAEFQEEVESKFMLYSESPMNWVDASRRNTLTGLIRLVIGQFVYAGEGLATAEWLRDMPRPYSTALQVIDTDRLSNPYGEMDTPFLTGGVAKNKFGAPQGFHFRMGHPTDVNNVESYRWKYVPAYKPWGRPQVIHIVDQMRPDQTRGISEMVAALKEMRMTKNYRDVVLQNAVLNATYAATIESELPSEAVFSALGGGQGQLDEWAAQYLGSIAQYTSGAKSLHIDGVKIPHLFPGTKLTMQNAGTPGGMGTNFEMSLLRYLAATFNMSYEEFSRDFSNSNYSSLRAGINQTRRSMQAKKRMVADRFASIAFRLWLEEAINAGQIESMPANVPSWYDGQNADAYSSCEWIGASLGQIDELKETQAAVLRLKYHLSTREEEMARLGKDWRKSFAQSERENKEMKERGLVVEESNAINAASGATREKDGTRNDESDQEDAGAGDAVE